MKHCAFTLLSVLLAAAAFGAGRPSVDFTRTTRAFNPALHGAGYAPCIDSRANYVPDADLKPLNLYESRTHDWFANDRNQRVVDVDQVFPLLHLDPSNAVNYVFAQTDDDIRMTRTDAAGAQQICYRLGQSTDTTGLNIRNDIPTNFAAYAEACAGIVRHYTRKWANGMTNAVDRWEIWDSPDSTASWYREGLSSDELRTEFAAFYATVLKRLRDEFGDTITVGGPGLETYDETWLGAILDACDAKGVRPNFVSWRMLTNDVASVGATAARARAWLDARGCVDVGLALDAWRYLPTPEGILRNVTRESYGDALYGDTPGYGVHGIESAVFVVRALCALQDTPFERAYYYGSRNRRGFWCYSFNGLTKNWYALKLFGQLRGNADRLVASASTDDTTVLGALSADGRQGYLVVADGRTGVEGDLAVDVSGLDGARVLSAVVLDGGNNLTATAATLDGGQLALARAASGPAAFLVTFALPDPDCRAIECGPIENGVLPLSFGKGTAPLTLYAAYGATDGGDDLVAWDSVEAVGVIPAETERLDYTLPAEWGRGARFVRFFFAHPDEAPLGALDCVVSDQPGANKAKPQWISSGIRLASASKVTLEVKLSDATPQTRLLVGTSGGASPYQGVGLYVNGKGNPAYTFSSSGNSQWKEVVAKAVSTTAKTTWTLDAKNKRAIYAVAGGAAYTNTTGFVDSGYSNGPYLLFRSTSDAQPGMLGEIYRVRQWDNNVLVRDFRPAMGSTNGTDVVAGLYDCVNAKFYPSAGSEAFTPGAATALPPGWLANVPVVAQSATTAGESTMPTLTAGEPEGGRITLTLGNIVAPLALAMAWGRTDAGDVPRHWENFAALGVVTNGTTSYVCDLPASWGDQVGALWFFLTDIENLPVAFLDGATMDQPGNGAAKPQWFDAGVTVQEKTICEVDWTPTALADATEWLFSSASSPAFEVYKNGSGYPGFAYNASGYKTQTSWTPAAVGERATWILCGRTKSMSRGEDTVQKIATGWSGTGGELVIGRGISSGAGVRGTIHHVVVRNSATLLRDFVPAQRFAADGSRETGFYDKVEGIFRASAGSSPFVAGAEIARETSELGNLAVLVTSAAVTTSVQMQVPHVARWRGDKAGAITYTFDDGYLEHASLVAPELEKHGFRGTFFLITKTFGNTIVSPAKGMTWAQAKALGDAGHDLGNHGYNSYYHKDYDRAAVKKDTWDNQTNIIARTGYRPVSYAYPNNDVVGFSDFVVRECGLKYWRRLRRSLGGGGSQIATTAEMDAIVDETVRSRSWEVFITHGITEGYAAWTSSKPLFDHLAHTAANADVWVDSMAHVGAYEKLRKATKVEIEKVGDDDYAVSVTPPDFESDGYGTLDLVNANGEMREFDPYAGSFHLTNGEIVYPGQHVHVWGEWEVTTPATETTYGEETRVCSGCSETDTRPIPPTGSLVTVLTENSDGSYAADFLFPAAEIERGLVVAFGATDLGADPAGWTDKSFVSVPAGATTVTGVPVPAERKGQFVRAFLVEPNITSASCVQDGLYIHYDAKDNAGLGRHDAALKDRWVNLVTPGVNDFVQDHAIFTVNEDSLVLNVQTDYQTITLTEDLFPATADKTVEVISKFAETSAPGDTLGRIYSVCGDGQLAYRSVVLVTAAYADTTANDTSTTTSGTISNIHSLHYLFNSSATSSDYSNFKCWTSIHAANGVDSCLYRNNATTPFLRPGTDWGTKVSTKTSSNGGKSWWGSYRSHSTSLGLGSRYYSVAFRSFRIYRGALTAEQRALNYRVDRYRHFGDSFATVMADATPSVIDALTTATETFRAVRIGAGSAGVWDDVEAAQVSGLTDENRAAAERTLEAIKTALGETATESSVGDWLAGVYGNQKVEAATLGAAKHVGLSVKYNLPLLLAAEPSVETVGTAEPTTDGAAAFVFSLRDGERAVVVTKARLQKMVQYADALDKGFAESTPENVRVTQQGDTFTAEFVKGGRRDAGFIKVRLTYP